MTKNWFHGKKVTVFGIGSLGGGVGVIRFLSAHGAHVIATDIKSEQELASSLKKLKDVKNVTYILGRHRREDFSAVDMVIKTPSCPWTNEHVRIALKNNIPVETDASVFLQICRAPVIGVTGTKGKTTTATAIHDLLKAAGENPLKVGIGTTSVLDRLDLIKKDTTVVFELSSWRLSALGHIQQSPDIAVFTNFFPDHLNYYQNMEQYFQDKKYIYQFQKPTDTLVYNVDNETLAGIDAEVPGMQIQISAQRLTRGRSIFLEDGFVYFNDGIDAKKILAVEELPLFGKHNHINMLLAIGAVAARGVPLPKILAGLEQCKPVAHRMEAIRTVKGVTYINDSAATAPEAARTSLESYNAPVVVLAGGSDKKTPFADFGAALLSQAKDVIFFKGKATEKLLRVMRKIDKEKVDQMDYQVVDSMQAAISLAREKAQSGDIVLLSPGAASFGVFKNEFDRGNQFRECVENL